MNCDVLSWKYSGSEDLVTKGHLVMVDDRPGNIEEVCMPRSREAVNHYCEDTGGLLVRFDDGFLELLPFGHCHRIEKRS
jgi:hypothetical protein